MDERRIPSSRSSVQKFSKDKKYQNNINGKYENRVPYV